MQKNFWCRIGSILLWVFGACLCAPHAAIGAEREQREVPPGANAKSGLLPQTPAPFFNDPGMNQDGFREILTYLDFGSLTDLSLINKRHRQECRVDLMNRSNVHLSSDSLFYLMHRVAFDHLGNRYTFFGTLKVADMRHVTFSQSQSMGYNVMKPRSPHEFYDNQYRATLISFLNQAINLDTLILKGKNWMHPDFKPISDVVHTRRLKKVILDLAGDAPFNLCEPLKGMEQFRHIADWTWLTTLKLGSLLISDAALPFFMPLAHTLRALDLHDARLTDTGLEPLSALTHLTYLNLKNTRSIKGMGFAHLAPLTQLQELNLGANTIDADRWRDLPPFPHLLSLHVACCSLPNAFLQNISQLRTLTHLNLQKTGLSHAHLKDINFPNLTRLDLSDNRGISGPAIQELQRLTRLTALNLSYTRNFVEISDPVHALLVAVPSLRILKLHQLNIKDRDTLQAAFPDLHLNRWIWF